MNPLKPTLLVLLLMSAESSADTTQEFTDLSRYVEINVDTELQQKNPLKTIVSMRFPESIRTVGQAMNYALDRSGYVMPNSKGLTDAAKILISRPLPDIHREFKFVTLENLLKTLAGQAYSLLVDPILREVNFVTTLNYYSEK